jgi:hypothetical protein
MHSLITLAIGLALLALTFGLVHLLGKGSRRIRARILAAFVLLWGMLCAINVAKGLEAGYEVNEEAIAFAVTFGLPAAIAIWLARKSSGSPPP